MDSRAKDFIRRITDCDNMHASAPFLNSIPSFLNSLADRQHTPTIKRDDSGVYSFEYDIPGYSADQIEVLIDENKLIIRGNNTERGGFTTPFMLPFNPNPEAIKAVIKNGVIRVILGTEEAIRKTVKITVQES